MNSEVVLKISIEKINENFMVGNALDFEARDQKIPTLALTQLNACTQVISVSPDAFCKSSTAILINVLWENSSISPRLLMDNSIS